MEKFPSAPESKLDKYPPSIYLFFIPISSAQTTLFPGLDYSSNISLFVSLNPFQSILHTVVEGIFLEMQTLDLLSSR